MYWKDKAGSGGDVVILPLRETSPGLLEWRWRRLEGRCRGEGGIALHASFHLFLFSSTTTLQHYHVLPPHYHVLPPHPHHRHVVCTFQCAAHGFLTKQHISHIGRAPRGLFLWIKHLTSVERCLFTNQYQSKMIKFSKYYKTSRIEEVRQFSEYLE